MEVSTALLRGRAAFLLLLLTLLSSAQSFSLDPFKEDEGLPEDEHAFGRRLASTVDYGSFSRTCTGHCDDGCNSGCVYTGCCGCDTWYCLRGMSTCDCGLTCTTSCDTSCDDFCTDSYPPPPPSPPPSPKPPPPSPLPRPPPPPPPPRRRLRRPRRRPRPRRHLHRRRRLCPRRCG